MSAQRRIRDEDDSLLQRHIDAMGEAHLMTRGRYHLTLGQLIDQLRKCPDAAKVRFPDGKVPGPGRTYRGYYTDLAFEPVAPSHTWGAITVRGLLTRCQNLVGEVLEGYKGGSYRMMRDTPLWMSAWGEVSDMAITGLELSADESEVVLTITKLDP